MFYISRMEGARSRVDLPRSLTCSCHRRRDDPSVAWVRCFRRVPTRRESSGVPPPVFSFRVCTPVSEKQMRLTPVLVGDPPSRSTCLGFNLFPEEPSTDRPQDIRPNLTGTYSVSEGGGKDVGDSSSTFVTDTSGTVHGLQ